MFGPVFGQTLTVGKSYFSVGEAVTINFGGSTSSKDWVAIFTPSTTPGASNNIGWLYTSGSQTASETTIASGSVTFSAGVATVGNYKACLLANDGYTIVASVNFEVGATPAFTPVGDWLFDNSQQLLSSSVGPTLELVGSHSPVSGPSASNGAVRIGAGSHYRLTHGIAPNNGALVNSYSLRFDFKVNDITNWHSFLQTNEANSDDAEIFVGRIGNLGVKNTGYSTQTITSGSWNRMVVVVNNGVEYSLYLNAVKVLTGTVQDLDGRFALNPTLILFGDDDGEDGEIDVARVSLYNKALTEPEVQSLGGYEQSMIPKSSFLTTPYIQNITTNSVTVTWESDFNTVGTVNYGTTSTYGNSVTSTFTTTSSNTFIHKAIVLSLQKTTKYYYQVTLNGITNPEQSFETATSDLTPVGIWKFDDPNNLVAATVGNPLELVGDQTAVSGPTPTDGAVRIGAGSYYKLAHGMAPNNGTLVNTYSFVFDFKVSDIKVWHSLLQTNPNNTDDADVFIGQIGNIGVGATGYCSQTIRPDTWNRAVIVVNNGSEYSIYLNGVKGLTGYVQLIDDRYGLNPTALLFADNDGEDSEIDVAQVSLYNKALTATEVQTIGGYEQALRPKCSFLTKPYIQNVTPTSATIMWESDFEKAGKVNYGTSDTFGSTVVATVTPSGANTFIQKAVIPSLQDGSTYYFRAITNSTPNLIQNIKTATTNADAVFSVGIWGDSHNLSPFSNMASYLVDDLKPDFCFSTGDVTNNGNDSVELRKVFIPAVLEAIGSKVPFYESLGNHDVDAQLNGNDITRKYISQPTDNNSDASKVSGSFAYTYGNSVFISIDWTRYAADLAPNGWLETFLKSPTSQQAKFRFIFIHCAPFYERWQIAEQEVVKTNIPLLSKKYGITAVFSGHMHGYERGLLDGVQYITQGGGSYLDVTEPVGPIIYPSIIVGTNKTNPPANFNNGLTNHVLTLEITPTTATSKLHYFDASGKYIGVIESVEMAPRIPEVINAVEGPSDFGFSIYPNPTQGILKISASENVNVTVFDLQGKMVFSKLNMSPTNDLDLSNLSKGAYLVKLKAGQNEFTKTIVIE